jgi:hypothetical protein
VAVGWGRIYATLCAHGHAVDRLGSYTARQLRLFYREACARERRGRAERISDVNAGMAGGKHAQDLLAALKDDT